jgi:hypothetical protein
MEGIIIFLVVALIVSGILIFFLIKNYKKYTLIKKTETTPISMVYNGFYEVKGRIVPQSPLLTSPFAEKECVFYHFTVEQKKSSGKNSHWVKIVDDKKGVKFGVDDNTGVAVIDTQGADIQIKTDAKSSSGFLNGADDREKAVLQKYSQSNKMWIFEKTLRYTEKFLEPGDDLYVLGEVNAREGMKPLFQKSVMPLFVSDKSENELLNNYKLRMVGLLIGLVAIIAINVFVVLAIKSNI